MEKQEALEHLEVIKKIIEEARGRASEKGTLWMLCGINVVVGCLLNALAIYMEKMSGPLSLVIWGGVSLACMIFGMTTGKSQQPSYSKTFISRIVGAVWASCGMGCMLFFVTIAAVGNIPGYVIPSVVTLLWGIANVIFGVTYDWKWLSVVGGILMVTAAAILTPFTHNSYVYLATLGGILGGVGFIYPGLRMRLIYQQNVRDTYGPGR